MNSSTEKQRKFKILRLQAGLTQQQLARAVGVSENQITRIETARLRPKRDLLQQLIDVLGDGVADIFGAPEASGTKSGGGR
jgi:transcriptional regulator with XRE-family HTH domain